MSSYFIEIMDYELEQQSEKPTTPPDARKENFRANTQ